MSDIWLRRTAQILTVFAIVILLVSAVMLSMVPDYTTHNWLESQVKSIVTLGAPIVGLVIVTRQTRHRIGWLWIFYGIFVGFRTLGHAIYYSGGAQPVGYSSLEYFLLWFTEPAGLFMLALPILLMLWFPDGQLASHRWRVLIPWLFIASATLFLLLFRPGPTWNGGATAEGILIDNPYGWLPVHIPLIAGLIPFLSIVLITFLAAISLLFRYRAAGPLVRLQLRWFVLGGAAFAILDNVTGIFGSEMGVYFQLFLLILGFSAILPLYLAVGLAILRYRLYDIDVIIRRTLQYALLTGLLALVYFGSVVLLQSLVENLTGRQSPIVIVISTLAIAALFNPLRSRIQDFIDRRFYRKKYDAEQTLAQFAATARDEVDMDRLTEAVLEVVDETMQPEHTSLWIKQ